MDPGIGSYVDTFIFPGAFALLPGVMDTPNARAMLHAIALQESRYVYRRQIEGPARSFWQFERLGGVKSVLNHPLTQLHITHVCKELRYTTDTLTCWTAMEHNDVFACCFARLLLWTDPRSLPTADDPTKGWNIYLAQWRPGKPHPDTWSECFETAWQITNGE